jgi:hypothetical protein
MPRMIGLGYEFMFMLSWRSARIMSTVIDTGDILRLWVATRAAFQPLRDRAFDSLGIYGGMEWPGWSYA